MLIEIQTRIISIFDFYMMQFSSNVYATEKFMICGPASTKHIYLNSKIIKQNSM